MTELAAQPARQPDLVQRLLLFWAPLKTRSVSGHSADGLEAYPQIRNVLLSKSKDAHCALCVF